MQGGTPQRRRALGLFSGGLDSQLAVCLLRDQDIEVQGVMFVSPFFDAVDAVKAAADRLGVPLLTVDFSSDIISLVNHPKHGFGSCMNPCIDCHARMLRRAGERMEELGYDFLFTGEVLNERPVSQNRRSLDIVARESGYGDVLVRPLSAALLPETKPETMGWVDRSRLLSIEGRSRKVQIELAEHYGIKDYPQPAGGCRLTEPNFCKRLADLKEHEGLNGVRSVTLLRFGRHFRLSDSTKLIVGRNEHDNAYLEGTAELYDLILKVENVRGPTAILPFTAQDEHIRLAARICARYSDGPPGGALTVRVRSSRGIKRLDVVPSLPEEIESFRI
jgi:tRNA U34 2-thiouridine synthase MnmA/TrmU